MAETFLVTGANRGIGLAVVEVLLKEGGKVFATCRRPGQAKELSVLKKDNPQSLDIVEMDVDSDKSVKSAVGEVSGKAQQLDVLLNVAGILPKPYDAKLEDLDFQRFREGFETNSLGPLRVSRAFLPLLRKSKNPRVVNVTSGNGSISGKAYEGFYAYDTSKAALNMISRTFAIEFKKEGICCVALDPGWVRTDMGGSDASLSPEESATAIVKTTKRLTIDGTSQFIDRNGEKMNW